MVGQVRCPDAELPTVKSPVSVRLAGFSAEPKCKSKQTVTDCARPIPAGTVVIATMSASGTKQTYKGSGDNLSQNDRGNVLPVLLDGG